MISTSKFARRSLSFLMTCVTAGSLLGCLAMDDSDASETTASEEAIKGGVSVGLYAQHHTPADIVDRQKDLGGAHFDHVLLFWNIQEGSDVSNMIQPHIDAGRNVVVNLEFWPPSSDTNGNLPQIANGAYDAKIQNFIKGLNKVERKGQTISVRTLHEMNGNWYPWAINYKGNSNSVADFRKAFIHVSNMLQPHNVKMQINFNASDQGDGKGDMDWNNIYPGDQYVDRIEFTVYNSYHMDGHKEWRDFSSIVREAYARGKKLGSGNKPFGLSETGTTADPDKQGRKGQWFEDLARDVKKDFPKISEVSFFLENKPGPRCWDWSYASAKADPNSPNVDCIRGADRGRADRNGLAAAINKLHGGK